MTYIAKRGYTFRRRFRWIEDGAPVDLTGCSVSCAFEAPGGGPGGSLSGAIEDQVATPGEFTIEATAGTTAGWAVGNYTLDLAVTFPSGDVPGIQSIPFRVTGSALV